MFGGTRPAIPRDLCPFRISAKASTLGSRAGCTPEEKTSLRPGIWTRAWRLRAAYQKREVGVGAGVAGSLDPNARGHSSRTYLDISYDKTNWAQNWDVSGVASYFDNKEKGDPAYTLFPAGAFGGAFPNGMIGNPEHSQRHTRADVSAFYTGFEQHRIRIGTGYRLEDMYEVRETKNFNATFGPLPGGLTDVSGNPALVYMLPHKRTVSFAFAQDEWSFARDWALTAGVRHDRYSDFGGTTNPRLALVWDAAYNLVVKTIHGTAFRAPSFNELYSINNPVVYGNSNLNPETIMTDELAFAWQPTAKLQTNLNFFRYRMSDIIRPNPQQNQNAGDQTGRGFELESTLDATSDLRLTGSYSLQRSTDEATGQDAGMAPHRRLFVRADWRFAPLWQVSTKANYVADRMREPGDNRAQIPDYTLVDLTVRRESIAGNWDMRAMVTNLFDRDAREPTFKSVGTTVPGNPITLSDLPLPGRAFYLQFQHKL